MQNDDYQEDEKKQREGEPVPIWVRKTELIRGTDKGKRPDDKPEVSDSSQESKNQSGKVGGDRGNCCDGKNENASEKDEVVEESSQMSERVEACRSKQYDLGDKDRQVDKGGEEEGLCG